MKLLPLTNWISPAVVIFKRSVEVVPDIILTPLPDVDRCAKDNQPKSATRVIPWVV